MTFTLFNSSPYLDDTPYETAIADDFARMWTLLNTISPPGGHRWTLGPGNPLRWFAGSIAESTRYNASIRLAHETSDHHDHRQLHVEVRLGWDRIGEVGKTPLPEVRRATLWCEMGPRINFTSTSLLASRACFLAAPTIERLFDQVREVLAPALSTYQERLSASASPVTETVR